MDLILRKGIEKFSPGGARSDFAEKKLIFLCYDE